MCDDTLPDVPEDVTLPDSTGSLIPDVEEPVEIDYEEVSGAS